MAVLSIADSLKSRQALNGFVTRRTFELIPHKNEDGVVEWRQAPTGGILAQVSVAAATAVLGYDLLTNSIYKRSGSNRILRGAALTGSAAAGDSKIDLYIDVVKIADIYNVTTGFPTKDHFFPLGDLPVPAGSDISAIVTDAPGTNPLNLLLDIE